MQQRALFIRPIVLSTAVAVGVAGCSTAQLQKQYTSFDGCFKEQKVLLAVAGGLTGALLGGAAGNVVGGKQGAAAGAGAGAVIGAILGQKAAWQQCLGAFPVRSETTLVTPLRPAGPATPAPNTPVAARALTITSVNAKPLDFGRDLEVSAQYSFVSDKPGARDIKAKISRNLSFVTPDGQRVKIESSSDDTIQQGSSRTTFAIPTPSTTDAPDLLQTRDWELQFVVEAEGMRQERVVALQTPQIVSVSTGTTNLAAPPAAAAAATPTPAPAARVEQLNIAAGASVVTQPKSRQVVTRPRQAVMAKVLQRTTVDGATWVQVELPDGKVGWVAEPKR